MLELAPSLGTDATVDGTGRDVGDANPQRNHERHRETGEMQRAHSDPDDRAHPAASHPATDPAENRADGLAHALRDGDPCLPAAHGDGDLQLAPKARTAHRRDRKSTRLNSSHL